MKLIQVFGNNGSGKTTLLRLLADSDTKAEIKVVTLPGQGFRPLSLTVLHYQQCVLVGDYLDHSKTTAGVDRISSKELILAALSLAHATAIQLGFEWIIWEGIIIMTRQYHKEYLERGMGTRYVFLDVPAEVCLERVLARSGKTISQLSGNGKIVMDRAKAVKSLERWSSTIKTPDHKTIILDATRRDSHVLFKFGMSTLYEANQV